MASTEAFEFQVKAEGAEQAKQALDAVAASTANVEQAVQHAGQANAAAAASADDNSQKHRSLRDTLDGVAASAGKMIAAYAGLEALKQLVMDFKSQFAELIELQGKLTGEAVSTSQGGKLLARQLGKSEEEGVRVLSQIREASGLDAGAASSLGISADIAFSQSGGLMGGRNLQTTQEIARFASGAGMDSSASGNLLVLLSKAGQLGSPEQVQEAIAKISAAAKGSQATSIGEFVSQVSQGGTGMLQSGMSLDDVLAVGVQARQVEGNGSLAATSMVSLERIATGSDEKFAAEINRVAAAQGMDPGSLTTAQKIAISRQILGGVDSQEEENRVRAMMSPERGQLMLRGYRASNVSAVSSTVDRIGGATGADFQAEVASYSMDLSQQEAIAAAREDREAYQAGAQYARASRARRSGQAALERAKASGEFGTYEKLSVGEEGFVETEMVEEFRRERARLQKEGADVSGIDDALGALGRLNFGAEGYNDTVLQAIAVAIDEAIQKRTRNGPVTVNVTGTAYYDAEPGRAAPPTTPRDE